MGYLNFIACHVPSKTLDNLENAKRFGEDEAFVKQKLGALKLPRLEAGEDTSDLAAAAINALPWGASGCPEKTEVDALVVVTQNGDGQGLPHTSAIVQHKAQLSNNVIAFDMSLGCSGYVYGLTVAKSLLNIPTVRNVLLVTCDPYSKIIDESDRVTALLFGDAATASLISREPLNDVALKVGDGLHGTNGAGAEHLMRKPDGLLFMNGRQVFNFASTVVPKQISALLGSYGIESSDIDEYILHQGSYAIIDAISRRFPEVQSRFSKKMEATGNTVSSTIPLMLAESIKDTAKKRILVSGFGVGLSWASLILERS